MDKTRFTFILTATLHYPLFNVKTTAIISGSFSFVNIYYSDGLRMFVSGDRMKAKILS